MKKLRNSAIQARKAFIASNDIDFYTRVLDKNTTKSKWLPKVYKARGNYDKAIKYFNDKLKQNVTYYINDNPYGIAPYSKVKPLQVAFVCDSTVYVEVGILKYGEIVAITKVKFTDIYIK